MAGSSAKAAPSRGHRKRERTRRQLIAAGIEVLAERGEALSVSDVVARAEVSNGTFYNYFTDRDELIDALAEHSLLAFAAGAARDTAAKDPAWRFAFATLGVLERAKDDPIWGRAILRLRDQRSRSSREMFRFLRDDLADGRASGRFAFGPDPVTFDATLGLIVMAMHRIVRGEAEPGYAERVVERGLAQLGVGKREAARIARQVASAVAAASED